ncbi:kinase-like protein [Rhizophagus irregularis]|uniref:Kinase-like protein n=1 Tax=Rhizophagus irregularis TaxID=588596 RepID=A0A2I1H5Z1_9GLOM|nr:kinase-like protein [Rhizophagus irregularis]
MSTIRKELVWAAIQKAYVLTDYNIHDDIDKRHKFRKRAILADKSLTKNEKLEAIKKLNKDYDSSKIRYNEGKRRFCEVCKENCLAKSYCEYCIRNYLKSKFSNWTSGNNDVNDLIQKCQINSTAPNKIIEWIPYNNLRNIEYLTKGGFSEIYTADWIGGRYKRWNPEKQQLKISKTTRKVILKKLENVEGANRSWFDEAKSHLTISNKWTVIVQCYGLTQDPSDGKYVLVMRKLDTNLREFLRCNHNQLTWKERIKIIADIINALYSIQYENAIHRDLHSGNILYSKHNNFWLISDLGLCGTPDKPLGSVYGNLPYIAPEVIVGKEYTFASDIYSIAMIMWEISSGRPPFTNCEHNYSLAMDIVNGMRPKIISGTPLKYKRLMEQCWDADPEKRPSIRTIGNMIKEINRLCYRNMPNDVSNNIIKKLLKIFRVFKKTKKNNNLNKSSSSEIISYYVNSTSRIYQFENLPEPRNATEEEQETYHSKYSFNIPENNNDEIYNNPNFHPEEQEEFEIPDDDEIYNNQEFEIPDN